MERVKYYYRRALGIFSFSLMRNVDKELGEKMYKEPSIEKLENFILETKRLFPESAFYYIAGVVSMALRQNAQLKINIYNKSFAIEGVSLFEDFIFKGEEDMEGD
jgi:hypothetical protein